jgi:RES domain-containing protein
MKVWRLARRPFADLSGTGGRLFAGRWHSAGRPVIYTAESPALAVLEVRVNLDVPFHLLPDDYVLMGIDISALDERKYVREMPPNPRAAGDAWLAEISVPILDVPSVIVPQSRNYLLNPAHPQASRAVIDSVAAFKFDPRLWS